MRNRDFFRNPEGKPEYSMSCFWFWNDRIEENEMLRQQALMKEQGVGMPMIHSRFGREIDYLGEDWMGLVKASVTFAMKQGQKVWLYDEDNWPSGTCSKSVTREERYREHFLRMEEVCTEDREPNASENRESAASEAEHAAEETEAVLERICRKLAGQAKPRKLLEIWRETPDGKIQILWTASEGMTGQDAWERDGSGRIGVVYWDVRPYEQSGRSCVDYLNPDAIALFIEKTHEAYRENLGEELLSGVMGFFMDETRFYYCYPWTERFAEEFRKRKGYDLLPHLHELFGEGTRTQAEMDYLDTAAELYKEATFWQVYRWCEKYGLLSTAHLLGEETLAAHARFEIDLMRQYEAMHIPGIDHLGCGIGSLDARFAVSAARNYGKDRVSCEAFGAAGWETGMEEVIRASNWLIQQGINLLTVHGYYYSTRDGRQNDFPPSYFFQWKDWEKTGDYNRMAARMMELASGGRLFEDILVYYPVETFWKHYRPDPLEGTGFGENSRRLESSRAAQIDREYQIFLNGLSDRNIPFRIFNSDSAKNFEIREGKWVNRLNGDTFSTFVMVNVEILPENVQKLLKTFRKSGGRILSWNSGELEKLFPGGAEENDPSVFGRCSFCRSLEELLERCQEVSDIGIDVLEGTSSCRHNQPSYPDHLIDPYIHGGDEELYGMGISRYDRDGYRIYNFTNYNFQEEVLRVRIRGAAEAQIWNPENGEIREAQIWNPENGEIREAQIRIPENSKEWEAAGNACCVIFSVPPNRTRYLVCRA